MTGQRIRSPLVTVTPWLSMPPIPLNPQTQIWGPICCRMDPWLLPNDLFLLSPALPGSPSLVRFLVVHQSPDPEDAVQGSNPGVNTC